MAIYCCNQSKTLRSDRKVKKCSISDCPNKHKARGWCDKHYQRWERHGDPEYLEPLMLPNGKQPHRIWKAAVVTPNSTIWLGARTGIPWERLLSLVA